MTAIYKFAKWFAVAIVCVISGIVALAFVISLLWFLNTASTSKELPTSMLDLQKLTITVKSATITRSPQFIIPVEYPTHFTIDGQLPAEIVAKHPVNPGDHVDIYLTKKESQILVEKISIPTYMTAYGITLQNGDTLVDPNQFLNGKIKKRIGYAYTSIFSGCLIYFMALIAFFIFKKKKVKATG
jgi:hypothetical protein